MVKTLIFDMGGVLVTLDHGEAVRRFREIGLREAASLLDTYTQVGPFGALEEGKITVDEFMAEMSRLAGRTLTYDECAYGWLGYTKDAPQRNYDLLTRLRQKGYRLILLSNMNPFVNAWLENAYTLPDPFNRETPEGLWRPSFPPNRPLSSYFDGCYRSYEMHLMKPDDRVMQLILEREAIDPATTLLIDDGPRNVEMGRRFGLQTLQPINGTDWTTDVERLCL